MITTYKIKITGIVQGVGFRPHVYRCALLHNINGYVLNNSEGVVIHAETCKEQLDQFLTSIREQAPALSHIDTMIHEDINVRSSFTAFTIVSSENSETKNLAIPPDTFVCEDCLDELFNSNDRRYLYPFINCVHCGPRYSIITDIPYDRANTTMHSFKMCDACRVEYENPLDRRFHAQPIACPECGPSIKLYNNKNELINNSDIIPGIVTLLKEGNIIAVKGLGGYHLMADPLNINALTKLRERKKRDQKPFALLFKTVQDCKLFCDLSELEEQLLLSSESPIVLVKKSDNQTLSELVAPRNTHFGVMLSYTPLQHLLLQGNFACLVCTSANLSEAPILYEDDLNKFIGIADFIVTHDRKIHTFVDDSVVRSIKGQDKSEIQIIRRARGYTPRTITCPQNTKRILAVGAELKNTVCIVKNGNVFVSQHIGDLKKLATYQSFENVISHIKKVLAFEPEIIVCDAHPDFLNTHYASKQKIPLIPVQHHYAHMCACMIENKFHGDVIGVIFDGMGYGTDSNIWGGEFLVGNYKQFRRAAHFEYFPLAGGDICKRKISVAAFACLLKAFGNIADVLSNWQSSLSNEEMILYQKMINAKINSPLTSSVGRIFDVVSAILGLCETVSYEGQAAIILEQSFSNIEYDPAFSYKFSIYNNENTYQISLDETYLAILQDKNASVPVGIIAGKFHNTMVNIIVETCLIISNITQINTVALSGGCFQNKFLLEAAIQALNAKGLKTLYHSQFPTNDGSISLGQAAHAIYGVEK